MKNIKTTLYFFYLDITKDGAKELYEQVRVAMLATGFTIDQRRMRYPSQNPEGWKFIEKLGRAVGHVSGKYDLTNRSVELECEHLFSNQWNSAPFGEFETGARLFNAVEYTYENKNIRSGYWLDQTDEMREVLKSTQKCGYCGKQEPAEKGLSFCPHCIDSEYLTSDNLKLTRMVSVCDTDKPRKELSEKEREMLLPLFKEAQMKGVTEQGIQRIKKKRAQIEEDYKKAIRKATTERDGFTALMDLGLNTDNVIYYSHTDTFSFGWRKPVEDCLLNEILEVISEFPFRYTIKCSDGRVLSAN